MGPLLWMLRDSPGTGKPEVPKLISAFFKDVCGLEVGLNYHMVAPYQSWRNSRKIHRAPCIG